MYNSKIERYTANDCFILEYLIVDLNTANNYTSSVYFQDSLKAVVGFNVTSVELKDTVSLAPANQGTWFILCDQLGNSSNQTFRVNGPYFSNVLKCVSRNCLVSNYPQPVGFSQMIEEAYFNRLDFRLVNSTGGALAVNGTTTGFQIVVEIMRKKFI